MEVDRNIDSDVAYKQWKTAKLEPSYQIMCIIHCRPEVCDGEGSHYSRMFVGTIGEWLDI